MRRRSNVVKMKSRNQLWLSLQTDLRKPCQTRFLRRVLNTLRVRNWKRLATVCTALKIANNVSEIDETLSNMCSTYIYRRNWTISAELCTRDGTYISRQFLNADPSFEGVSFVRVDENSKVFYRQDYLPELKIYERDAQIGSLLGRIVKGYVDC